MTYRQILQKLKTGQLFGQLNKCPSDVEASQFHEKADGWVNANVW